MEHLSDVRISKVAMWLDTGSINLFGYPYAGKDTHGHELATFFNAPMLSGGEILRNSTIPPHVKEKMHAGLLVPSEEFVDIVTPFLSQPDFQTRPLILSSVGRWIGEEQGVIRALEKSSHPLRAVIFLNIDEDTVRHRWGISQQKQDRNRTDDAKHLLETRLKEFREKTLPVIDYYRSQGLLIEIDSVMSQEKVTERILDELTDRAS